MVALRVKRGVISAAPSRLTGLLACNYMQRPKNTAATLSRDAKGGEERGEGGAFVKLRNSEPQFIPLFLLLPPSARTPMTEVPLFFIERPRPEMTMKLMNGLPPTSAINVILPY